MRSVVDKDSIADYTEASEELEERNQNRAKSMLQLTAQSHCEYAKQHAKDKEVGLLRRFGGGKFERADRLADRVVAWRKKACGDKGCDEQQTTVPREEQQCSCA